MSGRIPEPLTSALLPGEIMRRNSPVLMGCKKQISTLARILKEALKKYRANHIPTLDLAFHLCGRCSGRSATGSSGGKINHIGG